jgi:hypothetical protein
MTITTERDTTVREAVAGIAFIKDKEKRSTEVSVNACSTLSREATYREHPNTDIHTARLLFRKPKLTLTATASSSSSSNRHSEPSARS